MENNQAIIYAGFWKRFIALVIDVIVVSLIVFPFALIIGLVSPNLILVKVPFGLFTTTEKISESPATSEKNSDGSTKIVQKSIEKDSVLGLWKNYYVVNTTKSNDKTDSSRSLIDPETGYKINKTTSKDIEFLVIFLYWILLESSVWQASIGKKVIGIEVVTAAGDKPSVYQSAARNLLKILSGLTLFIGFMMAGWTDKKQALHDKIPNMLVVEKMPEK